MSRCFSDLSHLPHLYQPILLEDFRRAVKSKAASEELQTCLLAKGILTWRDLVGTTAEILRRKPTVITKDTRLIGSDDLNALNRMIKRISPNLRIGSATRADIGDVADFIRRHRAGFRHTNHYRLQIESDVPVGPFATQRDDVDLGFSVVLSPVNDSTSHIKVELQDPSKKILAAGFLGVAQAIWFTSDKIPNTIRVGYSYLSQAPSHRSLQAQIAISLER